MDALQRLVAIEEIKQLKARYFRCLDTKDWEGMREVFAENARFDARNSARSGNGPDTEAQMLPDEYFPRGREAIVAFISGRVAGVVTMHHGHMHEVEVTAADKARGIIAMEDRNRRQVDGRTVYELHGYGHYHETYCYERGAWRIETSRITRIRVDFIGDYVKKG
jgi:hypothetical protein